MAAVDLSTHPGHLARRLQQAHYLLWNAMVSEEITSPQFAVLNTLVEEPGLDQRTVGERVGLDRSTMSEVITRLGRRGLLDKVRDPQDGRRFLLWPTEDGVRTHRRLAVRTARMNQVFLAPLAPDEQRLFIELIRRVADAAEELRSPAEPLRRAPDRPVAAPDSDVARHGGDPVTS
ncbi:MarR family winged helix-turn-helix transcriptional regulator [Streptomyces sp. HM190]|uniref:MarR family winged helix-turn-helix transcriptional regulator n=1 Tax=Streptomyces sp. HM190 TaxID=2695266 RepID=UPI001F16AE5A|nr:MarR family transcriptional regulator [Streptomyces sp. HM190]